MTPRQRVLAALNHQQPDRVPIDFGAHRSSGIAAIAYRKLRKALGLPERMVRVYDPVQQLAIIDEDVLDRFHVDAIELGRGFALDDTDWADWVLPDGSPCQMPAWAVARTRGSHGRVGHSLEAERPRAGEDARRGVVLRAMLLAVPRGRRPGSAAGGPGREHVVCRPVAARAAGFRAGRAAALGRRGQGPAGADRAGHRRPLRRQFAGDRAVPLSHRQLPHALGRRQRPGRRVSRPARRDPPGEPGAVPCGRRPLYRHHRLRRRPGDAERAADVAGHVPRAVHAAARPHVEAGEGIGRRQGHAALLRRHSAAVAGPDRGRAGRGESGADHLRRHGRGPA